MRLRPRPHVAQVPAPDQPPAGDTPPAGDATQPPAPVPDQAPPPAPEPAPAPATPAAPEQPAPELTDAELAKLAEQEAKTEVITVTGSLIGRREIDSPSPVAVVDREKLSAAGITNVGDILQKIPAQGNALNAQNNNGGDGSTRIDLRSLGTQRTLVLLNGRRVVSSGLGADDSVDIGTIPLAMIERVEVLKDGAAAIYGSDAVAGVVNIITRTNFNGTDASIYTSTTQKGDGTNYDLSFVSGRTSSKGNITFSAGYQNQQKIMAGDRAFSAQTSGFNYKTGAVTLKGSAASATGFIDTRTGPLIPDPADPTMMINSRAFAPSGCDADVCTGVPGKINSFRNYIDPTATTFGDAYNFQTLNYLLTPSTRVNLFSNGSYEVTKNAQAFYEASFNSRKSSLQLAEEPLITSQTGLNRDTGETGIAISKDSMYNPFGVDVVDYNRRLTEFGPRTQAQDVDTARVVVGLKGSIDEDIPVVKNWKWETSYNYGRSTSTDTLHGSLIVSHLVRALGPSFMDPNNNNTPTCGTASDKATDGCVPLSLFTPGTVDPAAIKYLTFTSIQSGLNEQHTAQATLSGKLVELPNHGDISVAVGGDYRFERGSNLPDPLTATGDTTGNANAATQGSYHTFESFGELSIVPVSGLEYLKWVEFDAAGRAYDYNTFGSGVTGKLSGLVRTVGGLAVRGTYGTAFRAPTVQELFGGQADNFQALDDPCSSTNTPPPSPAVKKKCMELGIPDSYSFKLPQLKGLSGGNTALTPEKATIGTVGVVYEPVKGLDFTVDYWHINIDNAIQTLPFTAILSQCYDEGIDAFCKQVERSPTTNVITHLVDLTQNVGSLVTSGIDASAAYQYRNSLGSFRHSVEGTYLFKYNINTGGINPIHGKGFYDLGVNPDLKFNVFTVWNHPSGIGAGLNVRFVDSFQECQQNNCNNPAALRRDVDKYANADLFFNYSLKSSQGTTNIAVGVNNVVNAQPPAIYNGSALNADESAYDFLGRQLYIRLGQVF